jgi:hypothetical protein
MLDAIGDIEQITTGRSLSSYAADRPTRRLPPDLQDRDPAIPWAQIAGIGNVLLCRKLSNASPNFRS